MKENSEISVPASARQVSSEGLGHSLRNLNWIVTIILAICVLPSLFLLSGWEANLFNVGGSTSAQDPRFTRYMAWSLCFVGLALAIASLNHYRVFKQPSVILPSIALLGSIVVVSVFQLNAGGFSGVHQFNLGMQQVNWVASQGVNSVALLLSVLISIGLIKEPRDESPGTDASNGRTNVYGVRFILGGILIISISGLAFLFASLADPEFQFSYADSIIVRPYDFFPLAIYFIVTVMAIVWCRRATTIVFGHGLLVTSALALLAQVHMTFGSIAVFDDHHALAIILRETAPVGMLASLLVDLRNNSRSRQIQGELSKRNVRAPNVRLNDNASEKIDRSLLVEIPLAVLLLTAMVALVISVNYYYESKQLVFSQAENELRSEGQLLKPLVSQLYQDTASDVLFVSRTPAMDALVNAVEKQDDRAIQIATADLERVFVEMLRAKHKYLQVRFIGVENGGLELANVKRTNNIVEPVPGSQLQSKGQRDYFQKTVSFPKGEVYYSTIELNREFNRISIPHQPVLRVATPIYSAASGKIFGIVVFNRSFTTFIDQLKAHLPPGMKFGLASSGGEYIVHENQDWVFNLNSPVKMQDMHPYLSSVIEQDLAHHLHWTSGDQQALAVTYYERLNFSELGAIEPMSMMFEYELSDISSRLVSLRNRSVILALSLVLVAFLLAIWMTRKVVRPLAEMIDCIEDYERHGDLINLPVEAVDEVGVLARSFHGLFSKVEASLEREKLVGKLARESSMFVETIIDAAAEAIITIDTEGSIVSFNNAAEEIFGYSSTEIVGKPYSILISEVDSLGESNEIKKFLRKGVVDDETRNRLIAAYRKTGESFPIRLTISEFDTLEGHFFIWLIRDISDEAAAEAEIERYLAVLEAMLESTVDGMLVVDENLQVIHFNSRFSELWHPPVEFQKGTSADKIFQYMNNHLKHGDGFESLLLEEILIEATEGDSNTLYLENGDVFWFVSQPMVIDGGFSGRVWCFSDMTEVVQSEAALHKTKNEAEQALVAKSSFLAMMSHEIRTPMNGVLGMLELLNESSLDQSQHHKVRLATGSANSLLTIINGILDFSKIEAGKMVLETKAFDLRQMLCELAESLAFRAEEKSIELILDLADVTHSQVIGDEGRVRQIITNLLGNALKFTETGEIVIKASLQNLTDDNWLFECSVTDTGVGIATDQQARLFDAFTQLDSSTARTHGGTGLGLTICKELCDLMSGELTLASAEFEGSTFTTKVKLGKSASSKTVTPNSSLHGISILVADDNNSSADVLRKQFEHWGAKAQSTYSSVEALALLESAFKMGSPCDVLFMTDALSHQSSPEFASALRLDSRFSALKLVLMTSTSATIDINRITECGFDTYFPKPFTTQSLYQGLSVLDGSETQEDSLQSKANNLEKKGLDHQNSQLMEDRGFKKLLLVEDNKINQAVAEGLLSRLGYAADVAENGFEALSKLRAMRNREKYDLVLMDCQMPEMDGYEATKSIRAGVAGKQYVNIPIIAMTASVMDGDRQKCIESGMSDYIAKPVESSFLASKLAQWLPLKTVTLVEEAHDIVRLDNMEQLPFSLDEGSQREGLEGDAAEADDDIAVWDQASALSRVNGKDTRLRRLVSLFLDDVPGRMADLRKAIDDEQLSDAKYIAHEIKGVAGNLGGTELMKSLSNFEAACLSAKQSEIQDTLPECISQFASLESEFRQYVEMADLDSGGAPPDS